MRTVGCICLGLFLFAAAHAQVQTIVFVCEHGSAKSVIAASYFNKLAKEKNIPWQAVSRGTHPDPEISPKTKKLLIEDNLLDKSFIPKKLSQADVDTTQQVILFCSLPPTLQGNGKTSHWEVNAVNDDFQKLRNDIISRITPLIDSLAKH
jgi:protein-tyrosine-phosphatase